MADVTYAGDIIALGLGIGVGYFSGLALAQLVSEILTWSVPELEWPSSPLELDLDFQDSDGSNPGWAQGVWP